MRTKNKASFSYQSLENRTLLSADGIVVADYRNDFLDSESNWTYGFNASDDLGENLEVSPLEGERVRFPATPTGDTGALALTAVGGHPGRTSNRFAIASWTAKESGVYSITDSYLRVSSFDFAQSDGVELQVFINNQPALQNSIVDVGEAGFFDMTLGHLNAGDSVRVAFGPNGNHAFDRFTTDFSIRIHEDRVQTLANFRSTITSGFGLDESESLGDSKWRTMWNAPDGWRISSTSGDLTTGSIDDTSSYRNLVRVDGALFTPTGANEVLKSPQHHLKFDSEGGHPGIGHADQAARLDRYAISAFTVERSGRYFLTDSFLETEAGSQDGVEVRVFVNSTSDEYFREVVTAGQSRSFDTDFERLAAGDTVYVAFGANDNHAGDSYKTDFSLVRELPRAEPLREIVAEQILDARDFGVIPNDRANDLDALNSAIREAERNGVPTRIVLEPGTYNFSPTPNSLRQNSRYLFTLIDQQGLEIDGQGATFVVDAFNKGLFRILDSSNIVLRNLTIDYAELYRQGQTPAEDIYRVNTLSQGHIVSIDAVNNSFIFQADTETTIEPDETFIAEREPGVQAWGYLLDGETGSRLKYDSLWHYRTEDVAPIGGGQYRISVNAFRGIETGDRYVLQRRTNVGAIGAFAGAENISVIDVTIHSSPSVFVTAKEASLVNVIRSKAVTTGNRWRSINADAVHGQSLRDGIWVEDSQFDAVGDDVMNFYTVPSVIIGRPADNQLTIAAVQIDQLRGVSDKLWQVGDLATFVDPVEGETLFESRVTAVDAVEFGHPQFGVLLTRTLTFEEPLRGVRFASGVSPLDPEGFRNDTAIYNSSTSRGFLVQGTSLTNSRRYGQFLMADDVQLVDNTYHGLTDSAIAGHNESSWPIGLYSSNVLVQNNRFMRNGFSGRYFDNDYLAGVVAFNMDRLGHLFVDRPEYGLSRIEIVDNVFRGWGKSAIAARNVSGLRIEGNKIYSPLGYPASQIERGWIAIDIQFSRDVDLLDNELFSDVGMFREEQQDNRF